MTINTTQLVLAALGLWISIIVPMVIMVYRLHRDNVSDRQLFQTQLATNDARWVDTQGKIYTIMSKLEMRYTDPNPPAKEKE